jgi:hypothetical protein
MAWYRVNATFTFTLVQIIVMRLCGPKNAEHLVTISLLVLLGTDAGRQTWTL